MKIMKPFFSFLLLSCVSYAIGVAPIFASGAQETSAESEHENNKKGPKGGQLFNEGALSLELLIFEKGMPPHFRAYIYQDGKLISPDKIHLAIELTRFNKKKDSVTFIPMDSFLQSQQIIEEPHSFDVSIQLKMNGTTYQWHYETYEGRIKLLPTMLKAADIQIGTAGSQTIKTQLKVVGKILPNRDTMAPIYARYAGIIKAMNKNLGDEINKGESLATIESNESLQNYTINAPITGIIVQKYATNGELAQNTKPIYDIANLNNVWADFTLYRKEARMVKPGMPITVKGDEGHPETTSVISYIAPLGIEDSQTTLARAVLPNEQRLWLPGMYVNGFIIIKEKTAPVAVLLSGLQRINNKDVVFVQSGDDYEATPVTLGQKDNTWVEVVSGLNAGQRYVTKNSFYLKAELGKEGASHED